MNTGDLIALLGDYLAILAVVIAFLSTQIEAWKGEVRSLEAEWSEAEHKNNNLLKLRHESARRALKLNKPLFPVIAPFVLWAVLQLCGCFALRQAASDVPKCEIALVLFAPAALLIFIYIFYSIRSFSGGTKRLDDLS